MNTALAALGAAVAVVAADGEILFRDERMASLAGDGDKAALDSWLRTQATRASDGSWITAAPDGRLVRVSAADEVENDATVVVARQEDVLDGTEASRPATSGAVGDLASLTRLALHAPFALSVKDADGRFRACNAEIAGGALGDPNVLVGRRARDILPPEVAAAIED
jgi:hypothetical protein